MIYKQEQEYSELMEIYNTDVKKIFNQRHSAVHHFQLESVFYWGNIENYENHEEQINLNNKKHEFPENMKRQLELCLKGFELALKLIDKLPDTIINFYFSKISESNSTFKVQCLKFDKTDISEKINLNKLYTSEDELKKDISGNMPWDEHRINLVEVI